MTVEEVGIIQQRAAEVWYSLQVLMQAQEFAQSMGSELNDDARADIFTYTVRHQEIGLLLERLLNMHVAVNEETGCFEFVCPMSHVVGEA